MTNNFTGETLQSVYQNAVDVSIPSQSLAGPGQILKNNANTAPTVLPSPEATVPFLSVGSALNVTIVSATESPFTTKDGQVLSNVGISFTPNPSDTNFAFAQVYFTGYHGSSTPQLMTQGSTSPIDFLCSTTGETVTITLVSVGTDGSENPLAFSPTTTVVLDGVVSAPAAPSIAQSLVATPTGYQFSFNQLAGLAADRVDGYQIYRNTTNNSATAVKIYYIKHNPVNSVPVVFQDPAPNGTTFFYWVTAVNTSGLESAKTAAQSSTVSSGGTYGPDGNPHDFSGQNLVFNGDFSLYAAPTGLQEVLASTIRHDDLDNSGNPEQTPNGWTRSFENGGNGEGVEYRTAQSTFPGQGTWSLLLQDRQGSVNDIFSAVSDAFPVVPNGRYRFSALVNAGFVTGFPTHATWYFRIVFYKNGTTDFSRASGTLSALTPTGIGAGTGFNSTGFSGGYDVVEASTLTGNQFPAATVTVPSDSSFARVAFYHWNDGTATASAWNLLVANVRCYRVAVDGDAIFTVSTVLNGQGGMVPNQTFALSYTSTSTSISITWGSASLLRADGSSLAISSGSQSYTGLTPSTTYWIYAYLDVNAGTVGFTNGNPPVTSSNPTLAAQAALDGRTPLTPFSIALPASGGGPGGTGGDGGTTCPEAAELINVFGKGLIPARDVKAGDFILGHSFTQQKDVYRRVANVHGIPCSSWRMVNGHRLSPCESVYVNGKWDAAFRVPGATVDTMVGRKIHITVEADGDSEHNYYVMGLIPLLIHNFGVLSRC